MAKGLSHGRPARKCQDLGFEPRCPESLSHLPPYAVILSRCPPQPRVQVCPPSWE